MKNESEAATVTAADIARLTGYGRAAVSNWRRRYDDFPQPVGGTASSPQFALSEVEDWLERRGKGVQVPLEERIWQRLRSVADDLSLAEAVADVGDFLAERKRNVRLDGVSVDLSELVKDGKAPEFYEFVVDRYLEAHSRRVATTRHESAKLMVALTGVRGATVLDPACGTGTLLFAAQEAGAERLFGQEIDPVATRIAGTRLALHGGATDLRAGDSLRADAFPDLRADVVLCDPPFGERSWGYEELTGDVRWAYGLPPRGESELAWVQHALWHTKPGGHVACLMPAAAADRRSGRRIRSQLLRSGALRAVFELPMGMAAGSPAAPHLWLLRRPAEGDPLPTLVLMADLTELEDFQEPALAAWKAVAREDQPDAEFARGVPVIELLDDTVDLTPSRHLVRPVARGLDFVTARDGLTGMIGAVREAVDGLRTLTDDSRDLPMTTMTELLQSGAVSLRQPPMRMETASGEVPVLMAKDVMLGRKPSGRTADAPGIVLLEPGDVVVALSPHRLEVHVVTEGGTAAGPQTQVLRPEPDRCDPFFLACFLRAAGLARSSTTTTSRSDVRRAAVPRLPLDAQRPYGAAFQRLRELEKALNALHEAGETLVNLGYQGLAGGDLTP
ncbi:N-6 DNA methylase [Actinocorallia populi]|uniref:N-6 DNA methylase n=1 Tax=Actinocorallia populi TaxID=2079200 RepID=UPI000D08BF9B|nr:N-6 DNA methylase [Actinocorallia populi]